jgi:hypothetical protein
VFNDVEREQLASQVLVEAAEARRSAARFQAIELERLAEYARLCRGDDFAYLDVSGRVMPTV